MLGTPFGMLPTLELNDGTVLAESNAIGRYVAKQSGMYGQGGNDVEQARIDMAFGFITDFVQGK